jgi:tRNA(Ile)-lysidine synthase
LLANLASTAAEPPAGGQLVDHLERFFRLRQPLVTGDGLLIAVSGGTDSTALLWGMARLAQRRAIDLHAAHLDHGLDAGSAGRAAGVARLCTRLGVPLHAERCDVAGRRRRGESPEAAARRLRYGFLERQRRALGARWLLTGHHADDQAETVLLRLIYGSGLGGLGGIAEHRGTILRPLLDLPRSALAEALAAIGVRPLEDPTNRNLGVPRNLVRHRLISTLEPRWPGLTGDLTAVARAARGARRRLDAVVERETGMRREAGRVSLDRAALRRLPDILWPFALARAGRLAGLPYPPGRDARGELRRQLAAEGEIGCDLGDGWRWRSVGDRLRLEPAAGPHCPRPFCRTFRAPGEVEVPELGIRMRLQPSPPRPWMLRGAAERTGLGLRLRPGEPVTVRSRRPGDRIRPLGCDYRRRLKEVLIDRRVPRPERDRLPLLEVGGRIVWVPGVTVDHDSRLAPGLQVWLAEIERT